MAEKTNQSSNEHKLKDIKFENFCESILQIYACHAT